MALTPTSHELRKTSGSAATFGSMIKLHGQNTDLQQVWLGLPGWHWIRCLTFVLMITNVPAMWHLQQQCIIASLHTHLRYTCMYMHRWMHMQDEIMMLLMGRCFHLLQWLTTSFFCFILCISPVLALLFCRSTWKLMHEKGISPSSVTLGCMVEALVNCSSVEEAAKLAAWPTIGRRVWVGQWGIELLNPPVVANQAWNFWRCPRFRQSHIWNRNDALWDSWSGRFGGPNGFSSAVTAIHRRFVRLFRSCGRVERSRKRCIGRYSMDDVCLDAVVTQ